MPQNSMKKNRKPKDRNPKKLPVRVIDGYFDMFHFKQVPVSEAFVDRFFSDLVKEAFNDKDMLTIEDFYLKRGLSPDTYYRWVKAYPQANKAHEVALLAIGNRREKGGLTRKFDAGLVSHSMPHYSKRWREGIEWRESLRQKNSDKTGNITVVMSSLEESEPVTLKSIKSESVDDKKPESVTLKSSGSRTPEEVAGEIHKYTGYPKRNSKG